MKLETIIAAIASTSAAYYQGSNQQPFISQQALDGYNVMKFLGGWGPYVDRQGLGISRDPPAQCKVDQVHMIHRHGERTPSPKKGKKYEATLKKVRQANIPAGEGSLGFLSDWEYFVEDEGYYALETYSGPYAGLLDAYNRGTVYRERYGHLWDKKSKVPIFTSGYERVVQTARKFGEGFFGWNYSDVAAMNFIMEEDYTGANSLTPVCNIPDNAACNATDNDVNRINPHFGRAAARLNKEYAKYGLNLDADDAFNLQAIGSFDFNSNTWSPWYSAFTKEEWVGFEYLRDLAYYYCAGPGAEMAVPTGSVWTNATLQLLKQGPENGLSMYWSFMHDTNITPNLAALGLTWPTDPNLPWNGTIPFYNQYRATDVVPMGAHFVLERLTCDETPGGPKKGVYIRGILNEAVTPFNDCQDGPGFSCSLEDFENKVVKRNWKDYLKECKIPSEYPQHLDFYWNYNTTTDLDHQKGDIPFQQGIY